jgi:hypothetical protein
MRGLEIRTVSRFWVLGSGLKHVIVGDVSHEHLRNLRRGYQIKT